LFNYDYCNKYLRNTLCPRGEIGRHKGLKILAACGVPVRVWPRAPFIMNKVQIISDKNKKSQKIKLQILKLIEKAKYKNLNTIVVVGGDGFMLQTLKKNIDNNKYFYGLNSGNYGFLMNKFSPKNLIKNLSNSRMISISPLEMTVKSNTKINKKFLAINEVSILRQSRQAASLTIQHGSRSIIKNLVSDGVLVSTPAGSTAYNLSVHGPILSLNSKKLSIAPISPFRPRRWKGKVVSNKSKITIKNLNPVKRPISAVADNIEVRNAKNIIIKTNQKIKFNLLYDQSRSLHKKIKIEQLKKETS
jgi:NAD+ kinase